MSIKEGNKLIAEFMGRTPEIEYSVSNGESICYSPKQVGNYYPYWQSQKNECERWLKEMKEKYPHNWVVKGNYKPTKYEWFPFYENDWRELMPVIEKIVNYHYPDYYGRRERDPEQEGEWDDCAYPRTFGMRDTKGNFMVQINASQVISAPTLIEATWLAVVDFINWFNKEQKVKASVASKA